MGKGRGNVAGRAPNWCAACLLGLWMVVSLLANASIAANESPSPMPIGGGRSSTGRRRNLRPPQLSLIQNNFCRPQGSLLSFMTSVSIICPTHTE
jgi:hypothetical protein